jgi:folylpolyglutamate synthase/dihydropteroate synthase
MGARPLKRAIQNYLEDPISDEILRKTLTDKVFVDYAFTPNALEKVYQTIKNNFQPKRLICVLGACGGGRDKWKRPVLGQIAAKYLVSGLSMGAVKG